MAKIIGIRPAPTDSYPSGMKYYFTQEYAGTEGLQAGEIWTREPFQTKKGLLLVGDEVKTSFSVKYKHFYFDSNQ